MHNVRKIRKNYLKHDNNIENTTIVSKIRQKYPKRDK